MAKKFKDDMGGCGTHAIPSYMGLSEYLTTYAPDILADIPESNVPQTQFWPELFEPQKPFERQELKKSSVVWPYADRIISLARSFLSASDELKNLIVQAAELKIYWRGDDYFMFDRIISETILFRRLEDSERKQYKKRVWKLSMSLGDRHEPAIAG